MQPARRLENLVEVFSKNCRSNKTTRCTWVYDKTMSLATRDCRAGFSFTAICIDLSVV